MAERIKEHPILGVQEKGAPVKFTFDGKEMEGMDIRTQYGVSDKPFAEQ